MVSAQLVMVNFFSFFFLLQYRYIESSLLRCVGYSEIRPFRYLQVIQADYKNGRRSCNLEVASFHVFGLLREVLSVEVTFPMVPPVCVCNFICILFVSPMEAIPIFSP